MEEAAHPVMLPGIGVLMAITMADVRRVKRRYVFEFATPEGSRAAFFLSASDKFVFVITDTHRESYPLEVPVGARGFPIGVPIYIALEAGVAETETIIRASLNGKEVAKRKIPFSIDLGSRDWKQVALGSDARGNFGGGFVLAELCILAGLMNDKDNAELTHYFMEKYINDPSPKPGVVFHDSSLRTEAPKKRSRRTSHPSEDGGLP